MTYSEPLITIGILSFNAEDCIARAIESALKQDWKNTEVLIVDDASTDNSIKKIEAYVLGSKKVRFIRHKNNQGCAAARQSVVTHAKGEYIAFFDDDDDNETDRLTKQYKRLSRFQKTHPDDPVLCYTHRRVFIDGVERADAFVRSIGAEAPEPYGPIVADCLLWHKKMQGYFWGEMGSCTMMASTRTLREFGFDSDFRRCAEWDLAIRVALQGGYFISVDQPLVIQHKTLTSDKAGRKPLDYALMLRRKHQEYLKEKRIYRGSILQAYSRFYYFRDKRWKSRAFLILACLVSPAKIMMNEFAIRMGLSKNIHE